MADLRLAPSGPFLRIASADFLSRVYDVSEEPYNAVAGDPSQAAHNTAAFMAAIAAAEADGGGGVVWIPPHAGGYYVAKNSLGPSVDGLTSALRISGKVTLLGAGPYASVLRYSAASGAYDCVIDSVVPAYTGVRVAGLQIDCQLAANFGIKFRLLPYLQLREVYAHSALAAGVALDDCFEYVVEDCDVGNNPQIGLALGAYGVSPGGAGQAAKILGLKANYCGKAGLFVHEGEGIVVSNCSIGLGTGTGIFVANVRGLLIDTPRFERNNTNPADGLVFTNFAGPTKCDIWLHRGTFSTAVPSAWTWTLDPLHPPTSAIDEDLYNNPGVTITNGSFTHTTTPGAAVAGNAYTGLVLSSNTHEGAAAPLFGFIASATLGFAMPWTEQDNRDFLPSVTLSSTANLLWGSTNISAVCETDIQDTSLANLIPDDTLAGLTTRFANSTNAGNGEIYYDVSETYEGDPIYKFGGGDTPQAKGLVLDLAGADAKLAGALIYVAATVEVAALPVTNLAAPSLLASGGPTQALVFGAEQYVAGWQKRAQIVRLPAAGTVSLGFSKLGIGTSRFSRPVIARLGAPYSQVVRTRAIHPTRKRSMWVQPYYAAVAEAYADGAGTICGVPMTCKNSAKADVALAVTPGAGLVIVPKPGTPSNFDNATDTAPAISFNLAALIPDYTLDMPVTIRCVNSVNTLTADAFDAAILALTCNAAPGNYGAVLLRGQSTNVGFITQCWMGGAVQQSGAVIVALSAANSGVVLSVPSPGLSWSRGYCEPATAAGAPDPSLRAALNGNLMAVAWAPFGLTCRNIDAEVGAVKLVGATAGATFTFPTIVLEWEP